MDVRHTTPVSVSVSLSVLPRRQETYCDKTQSSPAEFSHHLYQRRVWKCSRGAQTLYGGTHHLWILGRQHASCHPSGASNFEVAPGFVKKCGNPSCKVRLPAVSWLDPQKLALCTVGQHTGYAEVQFGTFWKSFVSFTPRPLYLKGRTLLSLSGIERFLVHPARSLVTMLTELSRLIT
jgi:hypothetical protein